MNDDTLAKVCYCSYLNGYLKAATKADGTLSLPSQEAVMKNAIDFRIWFATYQSSILGIRHGLRERTGTGPAKELSWPSFQEVFLQEILLPKEKV